jgi:hypothetical protein
MSLTDSKSRRRVRARPCAEALESRSLLTGGAGDTFAIVSATINNPGGVVTVPFTIDPAHIHLPHGRLALGIDVATPSGSTAKPYIDTTPAASSCWASTCPATPTAMARSTRPTSRPSARR